MIDLRQGDCLEVMQDMADESVTAIVTDPPYALEFMGKGWDKVLPSEDVWRECLRVLKPGGVLLSFGGTRTFHRLTCSIEDAGFQIRDCLMWVYGSGFPKSMDISKAIGKAEGSEKPTDRSRPWTGYGTALKPAWEPIILAMKPNDGRTFAANALVHGVAGINVDGCRIGDNPGHRYNANRNGTTFHGKQGDRIKQSAEKKGKEIIESTGRWPANVVHDGSDDVLACFPNAPGQQGDLKETGRDRPGHGRFGKMGPPAPHAARVEKDKSASRFFYCAKASKRDRGEGNTHPTVKPIELMRWLVRMVKMPSDTVVLDPFMGSGSTGVACAIEGVDFVGVERESEYVKITEHRIGELS